MAGEDEKEEVLLLFCCQPFSALFLVLCTDANWKATLCCNLED